MLRLLERLLLGLVLACLAALFAAIAAVFADAWRWKEEIERDKALAGNGHV